MRSFLGIDVGSVSTNLVLIDKDLQVQAWVYTRTQGQPIIAVQRGIDELVAQFDRDWQVAGVGATGSARYLTGVVVGADAVKNEITAHAVAALHTVPDVRTVLEIGGQDSKLILLRDGVVTDFAMNTVCAAGTGSFLDHQSQRLGIPIEEFGTYALRSEKGAQIAGRCGVFAESDMIHKQQMGYAAEDIIMGLCESLVRNYLNNLAKGKDVEGPVVFQGGVAANAGMKKAFEAALETEVIIPEYHNVMGALGSAILAKEYVERTGRTTLFKGFETSHLDYKTSSFYCKGCANNCEIAKIEVSGEVLARFGSRCGKWDVDAPSGNKSMEPVFVVE